MKNVKYQALRPFKFNFMGRTYLISYPESIPDNNLGLTDHDKLTIAVRDNQIPLEEADTVVHEIMHVLWYHMALYADIDQDIEERVIRAMATALVASMKENPILLSYLTSALKEGT
jgi:hypothetical protein